MQQPQEAVQETDDFLRRVSRSGAWRVADVLHRGEDRLRREDPIEPAFLEDDGPRLGNGLQRTVREPAFRKDAEGDRQLDVEVAEQEVHRRLLRNAAPYRLVGRLAQGERESRANRLRQRRLEYGHLLDRAAMGPHDRLIDLAGHLLALRVVLLGALHQGADDVLLGIDAAEM